MTSCRGIACWPGSPSAPVWRRSRTVTVDDGELVGSDDQRDAGAGTIGGLHLRLHRPAVERTVGRHARGAQLVREGERLLASGRVDHPHVDGRVGRAEHALGVAREQDPLDARAEADAGRGRPTELLGKAVVATAAADRVLRRVERVARELERGARVVVEPADEQRVDDERHADGDAARSAHDRSGPRPRRRQVVDRAGRGRDDRRVLRALRVEHAQWVRLERDLALLGQHVEVRRRGALAAPRCTPGRDVASPIELSRSVRCSKPDRPIHAVEQGDDLDVDVGIVGADRLGAELVVLAVATGLRPLVPEVGRRRTRSSTASPGGAR